MNNCINCDKNIKITSIRCRKCYMEMKGRVQSEETRHKISIKNKGKKHTDEAKYKMSIGNKGKKRTEESKRKASESLKGRKMSVECLIKRKNTRELNLKNGILNPRKEAFCINCRIKIANVYSQRCKKCSAKAMCRIKSTQKLIEFNINRKGTHISDIQKKQISEKLKGRPTGRKGIPLMKNRGIGNPNWRGGKSNERKKLMGQAEYKAWRLSVFKRDDYTCQICGQHGGKLQVDHIHPWATHLELRYDINNGRVLCIICHRNTDTFGRMALIDRTIILTP